MWSPREWNFSGYTGSDEIQTIKPGSNLASPFALDSWIKKILPHMGLLTLAMFCKLCTSSWHSQMVQYLGWLQAQTMKSGNFTMFLCIGILHPLLTMY